MKAKIKEFLFFLSIAILMISNMFVNDNLLARNNNKNSSFEMAINHDSISLNKL